MTLRVRLRDSSLPPQRKVGRRTHSPHHSSAGRANPVQDSTSSSQNQIPAARSSRCASPAPSAGRPRRIVGADDAPTKLETAEGMERQVRPSLVRRIAREHLHRADLLVEVSTIYGRIGLSKSPRTRQPPTTTSESVVGSTAAYALCGARTSPGGPSHSSVAPSYVTTSPRPSASTTRPSSFFTVRVPPTHTTLPRQLVTARVATRFGDRAAFCATCHLSIASNLRGRAWDRIRLVRTRCRRRPPLSVLSQSSRTWPASAAARRAPPRPATACSRTVKRRGRLWARGTQLIACIYPSGCRRCGAALLSRQPWCPWPRLGKGAAASLAIASSVQSLAFVELCAMEEVRRPDDAAASKAEPATEPAPRRTWRP